MTRYDGPETDPRPVPRGVVPPAYPHTPEDAPTHTPTPAHIPAPAIEERPTTGNGARYIEQADDLDGASRSPGGTPEGAAWAEAQDAPSEDGPRDLDAGVLTHGGLATFDPWAPERGPWYSAVWPWGLSGLAETLEVIALALIMFVGVRSVAHNYRVEGSSMDPTFRDGQLLIVNRLAYRSFDLGWVPVIGRDDWEPFGSPAPGDVVVFIAQSTPRERDFIKRVVGVPGQTVAVRDGRLFVDGVAIEEPYIESEPAYTFESVVVPPDSLFVLGDNRNNSLDSHLIGTVKRSAVLGRVDLRYWPPPAMDVIRPQFGDAAGAKEAALSP